MEREGEGREAMRRGGGGRTEKERDGGEANQKSSQFQAFLKYACLWSTIPSFTNFISISIMKTTVKTLSMVLNIWILLYTVQQKGTLS